MHTIAIFGFKICMRVLGPLFLIFGNILILSVTYIYLLVVLPLLSNGSNILFWLYLLFGLFLAINILFNYLACVFTKPGSPSYCPDPGPALGQTYHQNNSGQPVYEVANKLSIAPAVFYIYCRHCKCIKPPRCHHDAVTGRCVFHMDHYCPWMCNCVGFFNYRYFVLFLLYLFLGCVYCVSVSARLLWLDSLQQLPQGYAHGHHVLIFVFTLAVSGGVSVSVLLFWHIYLIVTNQTTIEFYVNMEERRIARDEGYVFHNPFDEGLRGNLRRVFGDVAWYLALLPSVRPPPEPMYPLLLRGEFQRVHTKEFPV